MIRLSRVSVCLAFAGMVVVSGSVCVFGQVSAVAVESPASVTKQLENTAKATIVTPPKISKEELQKRFDALFGDEDFAAAFWGVRVERADGSVLYERNSRKMMTPASNMKVVTTAAAMEILGPDFTYETTLEARGKVSSEGRLDGDIVIVGSGDPSLGTWRLDGKPFGQVIDTWVSKIQQAGIKEVSGAVVGDGRAFGEDYLCEDWEYSDLPFWYAAGTSGLNFSENVFRFTTGPGPKVGDPATLSFIPETKFFSVINEVKTGAANSEKTADITRRYPGSNEVVFGRTMPIDEKPFEQRGSVWNSDLYAATLLEEALQRAGIKVSKAPESTRDEGIGARIDIYTAAERKALDTVVSPPLSELIRMVNKPSHNFYADCIFRTVGLKAKKDAGYAASGEAVKDWLKSFDAEDARYLHILDGSGMARRDFVTPKLMCAILRHMRGNGKLFEMYKTSFPTPGMENKERKGWKAPELIGNLYAKTGYIGNVRSLSGYVHSADGEDLVFSMISNKIDVPLSRVDQAIDGALLILAQSALKP